MEAFFKVSVKYRETQANKISSALAAATAATANAAAAVDDNVDCYDADNDFNHDAPPHSNNV